MLVTFLTFLPVLQNGFVYWDDHAVLLENYEYRGFGWENLRWMFTTRHMAHYQPLTWLTYALDFKLWGMEPWGYHLTSLLFHTGGAGAFFWVARHVLVKAFPQASGGGATLAAVLAAILFAIHPLRVESVAWATERRDVTSGLFFMITLAAYLRAAAAVNAPASRRKWLGISLVAYVLSLLGKATALGLPLLLVVLDAHPLGRLRGFPRGWLDRSVRGIWLEKVPYLIVALAASVNAFLGQYGTAMNPLESVPIPARISIALYGIASYLYRTIVPVGLSPLYTADPPLNPFSWYFVLSGVVVAAVTAAVVGLVRRWPAGAALWAAYLSLVAPVCGLIPIGIQLAADRYTYLPCLGWALLAAGGWLATWTRRNLDGAWTARFALASLAAGSAVVALCVLTPRQVRVWRDTGSLWEQAIRVHPNNGVAHSHLANWLQRQGDLHGALNHRSLAMKNRPPDANLYADLGGTLRQLDRPAEAVTAFRKALELDPESIRALNGLGMILASSADPNEVTTGLEYLHRALRISPESVPVRGNLAIQYIRMRRYAEAATVLREGLALSPREASLAGKLAWLLATCPDSTVRNGLEAVTWATRACQATAHRDPVMLDALGAALAEAGRFDQAVHVALQAAELARRAHKDGLARAIQMRAGAYQIGRPWRDSG